MSSLLGKAVKVFWEDAFSDDDAYVRAGECEAGEITCELLGWVVEDDAKRGITVAREKFSDGRYRSIQHVPRGMVRKVQLLR